VCVTCCVVVPGCTVAGAVVVVIADVAVVVSTLHCYYVGVAVSVAYVVVVVYVGYTVTAVVCVVVYVVCGVAVGAYGAAVVGVD